MMDQTQPNNNLSETQPGRVKRPFRAGILIGLLVLIIALALGAFVGYGQGVRERVNAESTKVSTQLGEQFALVQQDADAGRYSNAQKRLEYIIEQDSSYPGAADKLAEILVKQAVTPSPVPTETPTITPTPDLRNQETIFAQAQQSLAASDWSKLMEALDSLRKADPTYKAVEVDGMYFTALRNRGVDQILGVGAYKTTNMEGGMYDLTVAERFAPLDGQADGLRSIARLYIAGSSFWDVNWPQAVDIFRQVNASYPNMRDASNITASQRLFQALLRYGDQLSAKGKLNDRCQALDVWNEASNIASLDNTYSNKWAGLYSECNPPTEVPTAEPLPTDIPPVDVSPTPEGG